MSSRWLVESGIAERFPDGPPDYRDCPYDDYNDFRAMIVNAGRAAFGDVPRLILAHQRIDGFDMSRIRPQERRYKPRGLWYACGLEWLEWCSSEQPDWIGSWVYAVELNPRHIFYIDTEAKLDAFAAEYTLGRELDWPRVAQEYAGVEFCPYFWDKRYELNWYSMLDVASGCVWAPHGVRSITEVGTP